MNNLTRRIKDLEERSKGAAVYPCTTPSTNGWYIGNRQFANLEEVQAAHPGRDVKPVALPVRLDLAEL